MRRLFALLLVGLVIGSLGGGLAAAQSPDQIAGEISRQIMSPFCDGVTLHDCPSAQADELRREIVGRAESGMSKPEIIEWLEAEYGAVIRATPRSPWSRIVPAIALVAGAGTAAALARRWSHRRAARAQLRPISAEERARLQAELRAHQEAP